MRIAAFIIHVGSENFHDKTRIVKQRDNLNLSVFVLFVLVYFLNGNNLWCFLYHSFVNFPKCALSYQFQKLNVMCENLRWSWLTADHWLLGFHFNIMVHFLFSNFSVLCYLFFVGISMFVDVALLVLQSFQGFWFTLDSEFEAWLLLLWFVQLKLFYVFNMIWRFLLFLSTLICWKRNKRGYDCILLSLSVDFTDQICFIANNFLWFERYLL